MEQAATRNVGCLFAFERDATKTSARKFCHPLLLPVVPYY